MSAEDGYGKEVKKSHPFRRKWDKEFYEKKARERQEGEEEVEPGTSIIFAIAYDLFHQNTNKTVNRHRAGPPGIQEPWAGADGSGEARAAAPPAKAAQGA